MDRNSNNISTDLILSLGIVCLTGFIQAEIGAVFSKTVAEDFSIDYSILYTGTTYLFSLLTPFSILIFFVLTIHYMSSVFGAEAKSIQIIEAIGFSFIPFFLNSLALLLIIKSTPGVEYLISGMIQDHRTDFEFSEYISLSTFGITGNIAALLFIILLMIELRRNLGFTLLASSGCVLLPPLVVYFFSMIADAF